MRTMVLLVLLGPLILASPAAAGGGTLALVTPDELGVPLSESELGSMRGGFMGLAFSVFFTGFVDKLGHSAGHLAVSTGDATAPAPPPNFRVVDGEVRISTVIGDFHGGSGIFQIAQVPGSFNVVNNNLFVQIALINVTNSSAIPALASLFRR